MRNLLLLCALWAPALPSVAGASGFINVAWSTGCFQDEPRTLLTWACDSNDGASFLTVSFGTDPGLELTGFTVDLYGRGPYGTDVPAWWRMADGECRSGSVSVSTDFGGTPEGTCTSAWTGGVTTWSTYAVEGDGTPYVHLQVHGALATPAHIEGWVEYPACRIRFDHARTAGPDACPGCEARWGWVLDRVVLRGTDGDHVLAFGGTSAGNFCAMWQGAVPDLLCSPPLATGRTTWGRLKSFYR